MKPNGHQTVDMIRVCDLEIGVKVRLNTGIYQVTQIEEERITLRNAKKWPQYFRRNSQQKVELAKSEHHDKEKEKALRLPISENGKVRH